MGIDIVQTKRLHEAVTRWGEKFLTRVFTKNEISYCYERKDPFLPLSVRFAAKEAFIKASAFDRVIPLTDIEVRNEPGGRPVLELHGEVREFMKMKGIDNILVSLSHEKEYGIACVVIEGPR